jgi:hypothetical protein
MQRHFKLARSAGIVGTDGRACALIMRMLAPLAALVLTPVAYSFPANTPVTYDVKVGFDGYIPLFGGQPGKVDIALDYQVVGLDAKSVSTQEASGDITAFELKFNGSPLQFTLESIKQYFPKTTIQFTPQGSVSKTDAPDITLPVRLPGLDVKHFPEITYLPIEFPASGIEEGKPWSYTKPFGDSSVSYTVTPTAIKEDTIEMDVALKQRYESFEDSSKNPVPSASGAEAAVTTEVNGKGKALFDRKLNVVRKFEVSADAVSKATNIKSKATEDRKLKTVLVVSLKDAKP